MTFSTLRHIFMLQTENPNVGLHSFAERSAGFGKPKTHNTFYKSKKSNTEPCTY